MDDEQTIHEKKLLLSEDESEDNVSRSSKFVYFVTLVAAFGSFTVGYDTGIVSGSMVLITEQFSLSYLWHELIVSLAIGPAIIGSFFSGYLNESIGRKSTLQISSIVFSIGALVMGCAPSREVLLLGRLITGMALGFTSVTGTVYISESAPVHIRGRLVSVTAIVITGSQFFASVVSGIFSVNKHNGWRYMLGLGAVPSLVLFTGLLMVPESPRWLISKGRMEEATKILQRLRGTQNVQEEVDEIKKQHELSKQEGTPWSTLYQMLKVSSTRKSLLVACGVMAIQQLSAINTIMYYTATIIKMAGVRDDRTAIWLTTAVTFTNFCFTFVSVFLIERIGRRKLILSSLGGVFVCLLLLAVAFRLQVEFSPEVTMDSHARSPRNPCSSLRTCNQCLQNKHCGFCYLYDGQLLRNTSCVPTTNTASDNSLYCEIKDNFQLIKHGCPSTIVWFAVLAMALYLASFAPGLGPVPFVISSEVFPLWARTTGMGCAMTSFYVFNLVVSMTFLHVSELLTKAGWFGLSASFCILGWIFIYFLIPETKGKRLEYVQELFETTVSPEK